MSERERITKLFSFGMPAYHVLRLIAQENISAGKGRELILGVLFGDLTFDDLPCLTADVVLPYLDFKDDEPEPLHALATNWEQIADNGEATPVTESFEFRCGMERCAAELRRELIMWEKKLVEVANLQSGSIAIQSLRLRLIGQIPREAE